MRPYRKVCVTSSSISGYASLVKKASRTGRDAPTMVNVYNTKELDYS